MKPAQQDAKPDKQAGRDTAALIFLTADIVQRNLDSPQED
jgi:hypothetical protein